MSDPKIITIPPELDEAIQRRADELGVEKKALVSEFLVRLAKGSFDIIEEDSE